MGNPFCITFGESETVTVTKTETINFQQWNLWRVWSAPNANGVRERYYDIEHEEEYLNNYASDMQYGQTQDGMPWGLGGVQLSKRVSAIAIEDASGLVRILEEYLEWDLKSMYTDLINGMTIKPLYDYYLTRDSFPVDKLGSDAVASNYARDYKGLDFNKEIATTLKNNYATQQSEHTEEKGYLAQIEKLNLTQSPSSAFAYCYHKNKRNDNGEVVEQKWFLPAIDEIEDIALGAYDEFDKVFQNEKYWSCQPAYDKFKLEMPVMVQIFVWFPVSTLNADFYEDDKDRARATSVYTTDGKNYTNIDSGVPGYAGTQPGEFRWTTPSFGTKQLNQSMDYSSTPGNLPRTESCRIRAVYRSGTNQ